MIGRVKSNWETESVRVITIGFRVKESLKGREFQICKERSFWSAVSQRSISD